MSGPLEGLRVLDFSTLLPGPLASLFLAQAGAEVIKVENPRGGDDMRRYAPKWNGDSGNFHLLNSGKKSLAADLKSDEGRAAVRALLKDADIVLEQFRPGVMARLGFGYEDVCALRPDVIYCSITGYGQTGPKALRAGHDLNYQGDSGLLALSHGPVAQPVLPGALIADIAGGSYPALVNILLALRQRDRTGQGAHLDIAMAENLFPFTYWAQADGQLTGHWPGNGTALTTGGSPRYALYPTSDGRMLAAAPLEQKFWEAFCATLGLDPAALDDEGDPEGTRSLIAQKIAAQPAAHWQEVMEAADCCCSIVQDLAQAFDDPHFHARGLGGTGGDGGGAASGALSPLALPICGGLRQAPDAQAVGPSLGAQSLADLLDGTEGAS